MPPDGCGDPDRTLGRDDRGGEMGCRGGPGRSRHVRDLLITWSQGNDRDAPQFDPSPCITIAPTPVDLGDHKTLDTGDPSTVDEGIHGKMLVVAVAAAQGLANEQMYVGKLGCSTSGLG